MPLYFYSRHSPLSNFYPAGFCIEGKRYATVEHYFQSMKTMHISSREKIRLAATPRAANYLGQRVKLRKSWKRIKEDVMYTALQAKFANPIMKQILLRTGERKLIENSPYDGYWGIGRSQHGRNRLGVLLMKLRKELQDDGSS